jgi:short-subunit dehydrogenase
MSTHITLKPLNEQVMVITGASSGIGMATALAAAHHGARLVLVARSDDTLQQIVNEINTAAGGSPQAIHVAADVADRQALQRAADSAVTHFGGIDTWVNNAGVSIYGRILQTSEEDARRLFDTNFWGVFNGSQVAVPVLRQRGGALINVGSEVSEATIPLQGIYSASKHAVKGLTDALRMELDDEGAPVAVTLIQPTATNTPFPQHAKNLMDKEPKLPTPMIDPDDVAQAILDAATHETRAKRVGMMARVNTATAKFAPTLAEWMGKKQIPRQQYDEPPRNPEGALHQPSEARGDTGQTHGSGGREASKEKASR